MIEALTGAGLAISAGLNAYIPLLLIGLGSRFLDVMELPSQWSWLENEWVLAGLAVLLVIEIVADKIPIVDSINDWVQTLVRPTAGGLAFGSGASADTIAVTDPAAFVESQDWVPIATGAAIALLVHLAKMAVRPVLNAVTLGVAAPAVSAIEDAASILLSVLAIIVPVLVIAAVPLLAWWAISAFRRARSTSRSTTS